MGLFDIFKKKKTEEEAATPEAAQTEQEQLNTGLEKTKEGFFAKLHRAVAGRSTVDMDVLDDLEEALITSDVGVDTTVKIIRKIEERVARDKYVNSEELYTILYDEIALLMEQAEGKAETFGLDANHFISIFQIDTTYPHRDTTCMSDVAFMETNTLTIFSNQNNVFFVISCLHRNQFIIFF